MKKKLKKKVEKKQSKKQGVIFANNRKNVEIKNIDFDTVYELAQYQCSKEEIYRFLKINKSELFNEENIEYLEEFNFNFLNLPLILLQFLLTFRLGLNLLNSRILLLEFQDFRLIIVLDCLIDLNIVCLKR